MLRKLIIGFKKTVNKLILFKELIYVTEYQQKNIIWIYHNNLLREYYKVHKIIKAISQSYYFLYIKKKVISYISKYDLCYKIKSARYKSYREIKTLLVLN